MLTNSLQMGDTLFHHLNLFSDGVFRHFALVSLIFSFPFFLFFKSLPAYAFPILINYNYLSLKKKVTITTHPKGLEPTTSLPSHNYERKKYQLS